MKRLSSLDYLRGLAAFGIMVFHYCMWLFGLFTTNTFLGKVGIYGVAIFYVLSGLTLFHVYNEKIGAPSGKGLLDFGIKRIFRIMPLLWLLSIASLIIRKDTYSTEAILLNFTGLFSLRHWDDTIIYGAWSIGNELAFYLFFPLFIFLNRISKTLFALLSIGLLSIFCWFAFFHLGDAIAKGDNWWPIYTNPLNQVFLFLSGYLIGLFTKNLQIPKSITLPIILASFALFILLPVPGDATKIITGWPRIILSLTCIGVCLGFYKTVFNLPKWLHLPFETLGEISYCLYLVHPLVWYLLSDHLKKYYSNWPIPLKMASGFSISILVAYIIYHLFERYFMRLGKKVVEKVS